GVPVFAVLPRTKPNIPSAPSVACAVSKKGLGTMAYRPLIGATLALGAGVLLASFWPSSLWLLLTAFLFLSFLFLLTKRALWGRIAFLSAFALLGFVRLQQV